LEIEEDGVATMSERNAADTAREAVNLARDTASTGYDTVRENAGKGYQATRELAGKGYDAAREYSSAGIDVAARVTDDLREFVRKEPWVAVAAAFAVGYVVARVMRRVTP
jgi:ElaB/YqjD/DUF883 family membrane-anchored ribosome-binding protein